VRLRLLIALGIVALLVLALLGVLFSTGRRLAASQRRLRQAVRFSPQPTYPLTERSI
jgi:hypothetical protein